MKKGFTLIELLIVIIIIGLLATMAVPQYQKLVDRAKRVEAITMLSSIGTASMMYYMQQGMPSTTISASANDLYVAIPSNSNWNYKNTNIINTPGVESSFSWLAANAKTITGGAIWTVGMKVLVPDGAKAFYEKKNSNTSDTWEFNTNIDKIIP